MPKQSERISDDAMPLAEAIEKRYPGVEVIGACYERLGDRPDGPIKGQHLTLRARKAQLIAWGLVKASDFPKGDDLVRKGTGYLDVLWTLIRDDVHRPSVWDCHMYTSAEQEPHGIWGL